MSRIGKKHITIPNGVSISVQNGIVTVKGKNGELKQNIHANIGVEINGSEMTITRKTEERMNRALHGTTRAIIANMVKGVSEGFTKKLELVGVGYKAEIKGKNLALALGYSHPIMFRPPDSIKIEAPTLTSIAISGYDRQLVGLVAAKIRSFKLPEPYKGKGVKYEGEVLRRKAGKTAASSK